MKQVERGHWTPMTKESSMHNVLVHWVFVIVKKLGIVGHKRIMYHYYTIIPSQEDHVDALGVFRPTIARWEEDRKEITSDPDLAEKATTLGGYKEARKVVRDRRETVERKGLLYALVPLK